MADMTVFEYVRANPDSTSNEIAKALNKKNISRRQRIITPPRYRAGCEIKLPQ